MVVMVLWECLPRGRETLQGGEHKGEIVVAFLPSAERGCSLSGLRARRSRGDPAELGSADLGLEKDFLFGVRLERDVPGENVWVALEDPGWWPNGRASGEGDLVGEIGRGLGDGVRAKGDRGMCPTDFRRDGECKFLVLICSLCFKPWRDDGRAEEDDDGPAGEHGAELSQDSPGEEIGDSGRGDGE